MKNMSKLYATSVSLLCLFGCGDNEGDTTDYDKPFNATERRNEAFHDNAVKSIVQDRANERAYQQGR